GNLLWTSPTLDSVPSDVAIGPSGRIYTGTSAGTVYALSPATGEIAWQYAIGSQIFRRPTVDANETVYVGSLTQSMYAVRNGSVLWSFPTGDVVSSSPAIDANHTIYFGSNDGYLYAVGE